MMTFTDFILFYGSEVWADALKVDCRLKILLSIQRTAELRVALAYMTASKSAILIISGVIRVALQASERKGG